MKEYKQGEYISYKVKFPGMQNEMHGHGTVEKVVVKDGKTQYLVSEGNGGQNMTYVNPKDIVTLLNG
jgi:oxalate decarboxylase/phosphoglucose isomerase-like protein (cupin superfamily)